MPAAGRTFATTRHRIRSDARELRNLRQRIRSFLDEQHVAAARCDDLILVLNELATNAIEAAALGSDVTVDLTVEAAQVRIAVENVGPPFTLPGQAEALPRTDVRGRGLVVTRQIVSDLVSEPTVDGTRVVATCRRN